MQRLCVFLALVAIVYGADDNCTDSALNFEPNAIACQDTNPSICPTLFGTPVAPGAASSTRNASCYSSEGMKKLALENCAKHCGFCCQTPAFNCKNKEVPRIPNCAVTPDMCSQAAYKPIIAEDCPNKCGYCLEGGCVDAVTGCSTTFCITIGMEPFVQTNCRRTCNLCSTTTVAPATTTRSTGGSSGCGADANKNCATWAKNGFCSNTFYTLEYRKATCGTTCRSLC